MTLMISTTKVIALSLFRWDLIIKLNIINTFLSFQIVFKLKNINSEIFVHGEWLGTCEFLFE